MEYIHKAKAEKNRTKVLTDQMEARRVKNKVRSFGCLSLLDRCSIVCCIISGGSRASGGPCGGEAVGYHGGREGCRGQGVTVSHSSTTIIFLSFGVVIHYAMTACPHPISRHGPCALICCMKCLLARSALCLTFLEHGFTGFRRIAYSSDSPCYWHSGTFSFTLLHLA